ncbi:MAG: response regulator [Anaerolineae bacterium]|jgi:signal transduction histidine kinase
MSEQTLYILVVEDEDAHSELIRRAFALHAGRFRLVVVESLEEARACLAQHPQPDLVIADLLLPNGQGIELLPKDKNPIFPLVVMTSYGDEKAAVEAIKAGALDYVVKSVRTLPDIPHVAERALREWEHIVERARVEKEIRKLNEELERRVMERTAELRAVNKELEAFAHSVSHDLRTPLRGVREFSRALLQDHADQLDAQGRDYLQRIHAASQRMGQLIDDLLEMSRITRGEIRRERVDLSVMAQKIAAELQGLQKERQVIFDIRPGLVAHGDACLLRVVLSNLLGNAYKFTGERELARIEFGRTQVGGVSAYFVRDNGAGFDMTYAEERLFAVFKRLHSDSEFEGTGVGLATVQRIIHRHGGRVWAKGKVNRGATFYFTL